MTASGWSRVCPLDDLVPGRGVAAIVGDEQVAVFRVPDCDEVLAVSHRDPIAGANVIARGLLGESNGSWYVASPMHKHRFDLRTGACLDRDDVRVRTFAVQVVDTYVYLRAVSPDSSP